MKLFQKMKAHFVVRYYALRFAISQSLKVKYLAAYEFLTLKAMQQSNKMLRKLIVLKGKNPDYIAPPPPPSPPVVVKEEKLQRKNLAVIQNNLPWIKNLALHPVLQSRRAFETTRSNLQATAPVQVIKPVVIPVVDEEVNDEPFVHLPEVMFEVTATQGE